MERNNKDFNLLTPNYTAEIFGPCFPCEKSGKEEKEEQMRRGRNAG